VYLGSVLLAVATGLATLAFSRRPLLSDVLGVIFILSVGAALAIEYRRGTSMRANE
jgi:hypothetical protein